MLHIVKLDGMSYRQWLVICKRAVKNHSINLSLTTQTSIFEPLMDMVHSMGGVMCVTPASGVKALADIEHIKMCPTTKLATVNKVKLQRYCTKQQSWWHNHGRPWSRLLPSINKLYSSVPWIVVEEWIPRISRSCRYPWCILALLLKIQAGWNIGS